MSGRVRDMMAGLYDDETRGEFVFQNERTGLSINDIKTGFTGACREAGILNLTFHDLRSGCRRFRRARLNPGRRVGAAACAAQEDRACSQREAARFCVDSNSASRTCPLTFN